MNTPAINGSGGPCVSAAPGQGAKRLSSESAAIRCDRLIKPDGSTVGHFASGMVARCARHAWAQAGITLRSVATTLQSSEVEPVEPGDGPRLDLVKSEVELGPRCADWLCSGAVEVKVSRIELNAWQGPQPARELHHGQVGSTFFQLVVIAPT
jgi:hypothetical protein